MAFGFGLGFTRNYVAAAFSPLSLFSAGEQGGWYDPSDLTTLFQDSAGTTPVTAVEQPVGLMLDKRLGLALGSNTASSDLTTWSKGGTATTPTATTATFPAANDYIYIGASTAAGKAYQISVVASGSGTMTLGIYGNVGGFSPASGNITLSATPTEYTVTRYFNPGDVDRRVVIGRLGAASVTAVTITSVSVRELPGNHAYQSTSASRPVLSARVNLLTATETLATQSVTVTAGTHTLYFTGAGSITLSGAATGTYSAGSHSITTTAASLTLTVSGSVLTADLRRSNDGVGLPSYQRVNTSTDYDTTGFPLYLRFDGVDDWLITNSVNFTATDKVTCWTGLRKISDTPNSGIVYELSATDSNSGVFSLWAPFFGTNFATRSRGTALSTATSTSAFAAPVTSVICASQAISTDTNVLRINGTQNVSDTADQGSGNYGNYPLYIGRRSGTSAALTGRCYGLIVRGAASDATQIAQTETWMNGKTKAY